MKEHLADQVRALVRQGMRPPEIARKLSVSRQWVYVLCAKEGIAYPRRSDIMPAITAPDRSGLKSGVAGAIAEMIVAADLLRQGFDVYRSMVNNSRGFDLVAIKDGKFLTFEVRSAWRNDSGKLSSPYKLNGTASNHAFVVVGEPIIYAPELPRTSPSQD